MNTRFELKMMLSLTVVLTAWEAIGQTRPVGTTTDPTVAPAEVAAHPLAAEPGTNAVPSGRATVAVMRWGPVEPPPMAPEDHHWLRTFTRLVASELRQVAALRVLPENAVLRESAQQKRDELNLQESERTNPAAGIRMRAISWAAYCSASRSESGNRP